MHVCMVSAHQRYVVPAAVGSGALPLDGRSGSLLQHTNQAAEAAAAEAEEEADATAGSEPATAAAPMSRQGGWVVSKCLTGLVCLLQLWSQQAACLITLPASCLAGSSARTPTLLQGCS